MKSRNLGDLQGSFDDTLEKSELPDAAIDMAETSIDNLMDNPLVKELPLVKLFAGVLQAGINIHDKLFLKKILSFLSGISEVNSREREDTIRKINDSKKFRLKVGEKLLYIIDRCNDYESSELVAQLFKAFLTEDISYEEYVIAAEIVSSLPASDIHWFIEEYAEAVSVDDLYVPIYTGLYMLSTEPVQVSIENEDDHKALMEGANPIRTSVSGGGVWAQPSRAGQIIYRVLGARDQA